MLTRTRLVEFSRRVRWWSRVLFGHLWRRLRQRPGLAPGTLGLGAVARRGDDQYLLERSRTFGPVFTVLWSQTLATCVVGLERGRALLSTHTDALVPRALEIESLVPKGFLRRMLGADHRRYRAGFLEAFRSEPLAIFESDLRHTVREELGYASQVQRNQPPAPEQLRRALDRAVLRMLLLVGFDSHRGTPDFEELDNGFAALRAWEYPRSTDQITAYERLRTTVFRLAQNIHSDPDDGRPSVLRSLVRGALGPTIDDTTVGNLIYMIDTGRYDMRGFFRWIIKYLSDHPEVVQELRAQPRSPAGTISLAEACVMETLRLDQAESLNRDVVDDIEFEGQWIPKGSAVRVLLRESHRNGEVFADPDQYRPTRFVEHRYGGESYAPFGLGEHRCIAGPLVIRLATLMVEELAQGFDWNTTGDGQRHRGRYHWEPSPSFAIRLCPRDREAEGVVRQPRT